MTNLKDLAAQLHAIEAQLAYEQSEIERAKQKSAPWTIKGYRDDQDWHGELWFTDVYAIDEYQVWEQVAWLAKTFHMQMREVSVFPGRTEEFRGWEKNLGKTP